MKMNRLFECQFRIVIVMAMIDSSTFNHQHETVGIFRHHLQGFLCHFHERWLGRFIIKQMILHVTFTKQTQQLIKMIDIAGMKRCLNNIQGRLFQHVKV